MYTELDEDARGDANAELDEDARGDDNTSARVTRALEPAELLPAGWWNLSKVELREIIALGWPNSVSAFASFLPGFLMLMFFKDPNELAAAGMGFMFGNVTGVSVIIGFSTGLSPLASQAFGAGNLRRVGQLLQRQVMMHLLLICVPVAVIWLATEPLLLFLGQPPEIAALSRVFLYWRIVALPFLALQQDLTLALQAQRVVKGPMILSCIMCALNVVLLWACIEELGFIGAPLALTITNVLSGVLLLVLAPRWCDSAALPKWSLAASFDVKGWGELLRLSLPGAFMLWAEWWGWEINLLFAGLLCKAQNDPAKQVQWRCAPLDLFPILSSTMVISFFVHVGFSIAAGAHVGNLLGASHPGRARTASRATLMLVLSIAAIESSVLLACRKEWGKLFTPGEPELVDMVGEQLPLIALYVLLDALGPGALNSLLRGVGLMRIPAVINVTAFYVFGIPTGLGLAFGLNWGIVGLWTGLLVGMGLMVLGLALYLDCGVDWEKAAAAASAAASAPVPAIADAKAEATIELQELR
jgi:MATE family multidrug resistance protein